MFTAGFDELALRLRERFYTSVQDFSRDLSAEMSKVLAKFQDSDDAMDIDDIEAIHNQLHEVKPGTAEHHALSQEQKEIKKLAKRIVKAVKEPLEDALKKEAELKGREHEEAIRKLDSMGIFASAANAETDDVAADGKVAGKRRSDSDLSALAGASPDANHDTEMRDADRDVDEAVINHDLARQTKNMPVSAKKRTPASNAGSHASSDHDHPIKHVDGPKPTEPLSPPISTDSNGIKTTTEPILDDDVFAQGGVPWYLKPFDPVGTTVHEERYTGREVLRDMSDELSDMDEDTLTELAGVGIEASLDVKGAVGAAGLDGAGDTLPVAALAKKGGKKSAPRRKGRFTKRIR